MDSIIPLVKYFELSVFLSDNYILSVVITGKREGNHFIVLLTAEYVAEIYEQNNSKRLVFG